MGRNPLHVYITEVRRYPRQDGRLPVRVPTAEVWPRPDDHRVGVQPTRRVSAIRSRRTHRPLLRRSQGGGTHAHIYF